MFKKIAGASLMALSLSSSLGAQEMVYPDTMVIMDVSNSMWGQIDGISKMEIARGVIGNLLADLQSESEFGLIAYGHREASDCGDIELILPIGPLDGEAFSAAIDELQPRGRTPLTAAVQMAAEVMDFESRSARIILLTDGLESCDTDPCAAASALENSGLDFTTHVIGFGVANIEDQSQISCIAEITGGSYLTADTAAELNTALEFMAMPVVQPQITLRAVDSMGNVIEDATLLWSIINLTDQDMMLRDEQGATVSVKYQADDYRAIAQLGDQTAELEFSFDGQADSVFDIAFIQVEPSDASIDAPADTLPGQEFEVSWDGPDGSGDYIAIADLGSILTTFSDYARTNSGSTVILTAPDTVGIYEIRYISPTNNRILATDTVYVGEIDIALSVPTDVLTNDSFEVTWDGPLFDGDSLVLTPLGASESDFLRSIPAGTDLVATFSAPALPGEYEIQYHNIDGKILSSAPLHVTYTVSLEAPEDTIAGADIIIEWTGPDNEGDFITIVSEDADDAILGNFGLTRDGAQTKIMTSDTAGNYEIRYVTGDSQTVIARLPLLLLEPVVSIQAPAEANSGETVEILWEGPNNQNDYLTVVPLHTEMGVSDNYSFARQGSPMTIQMPADSGNFEIRYVTGQSGLTLFSAPIKLSPEPTLLRTQDNAIAGSTVIVAWQGPEMPDDLIAIVPVGTADDTYDNFAYAREGSEIGLVTKEVTGEFEIRYVSGASGEILARLSISIVAPPVTIEATSIAVAGATISVEWNGPDEANDYITIVPIESDTAGSSNYSYTRTGMPLNLLTKDIPGDYEIRYISDASKEVLARAPITLTAPISSLSTVAEAIAGAEILVTWDGPDNQNDFVTIVPIDAENGEYGNYTYTRRGATLKVLTLDIAGAYEVRYVSGQSYRTLATAEITLVAPVVTIDASPVGTAGTYLEVTWSGPSNKNDFLTIVPVGSPNNALGAYQYARKGNPLELMLPDEAGAFEIRYVSGQSMHMIHSLPLTILAE